MRGPFILPNYLAADHERLFAKELQNRGDVDQRQTELIRDSDDPLVTGADIGPAGFRIPAELAHRLNPPADAVLRFDQPNPVTVCFEHSRGMKARQARADDCDVAIAAAHCPAVGMSLSASSLPQRLGFDGAGRPDRQQFTGQKSCFGGSSPTVARFADACIRSRIRS